MRRCVAVMAERPDIAGWPRIVERALTAALQQKVTVAWGNGWQPADVVRMVRRSHDNRHVRLATDAIAAEMRTYAAATVDDHWQDQLAALDARVWWEGDDTYWRAWSGREGIGAGDMITCALRVLHVLATLPRLERLCPLPGTARPTRRKAASTVDDRMLTRVRALLAKAESTEFPAEAETFTSAAQALMARHSIDAAMLATGPDATDKPKGRRLGVDAPYEGPKAVLLDIVASANRCRAVWSSNLGFCTVLGFAADLNAVELLYTSLLVQATSAMVHAGSRRDVSGRSRTRSFRHSFLSAYAQRIGERLREVSGEAVQQAVAETGRDLLPVLAAREQAVEEVVETMFPQLKRREVGAVNNREGWLSGRAAADLATIHSRTGVTRR